MKTIYYTVYYETYDDGSQNGIRQITVYTIENNTPKIFFVVEAYEVDAEGFPEFSNEEEIQTWLDNNGYEDEEFNFVAL